MIYQLIQLQKRGINKTGLSNRYWIIWLILLQIITNAWFDYSLHMIQVIKSVDHTKLENSWQNFEGIAVTLRQVIDGYLGHIELHLNEIQELIEQ